MWGTSNIATREFHDVYIDTTARIQRRGAALFRAPRFLQLAEIGLFQQNRPLANLLITERAVCFGGDSVAKLSLRDPPTRDSVKET